MKKVKIGVMGLYRGASMINYCEQAENAELVAICDKWEEGVEKTKARIQDDRITYYTDFDEFIKHDMDAVILANYATEHAPFAIKAMEAGKHVYSEVLPVQTMAEAVALVEAVERTGKIYAYGENYCYMPAPYEMRRLYRDGRIGEFEYAEGEYVHNCESCWHSIAYGDPDHWRNHLYSTYYCTHSFGPIRHITGLRPVSVIGIESTRNERSYRKGRLGAEVGIEMITLENGGIVKSIHGELYKNSIWYTVYGNKGRMESSREDAEMGGVLQFYANYDEFPGGYGTEKRDSYKPTRPLDRQAVSFGHGGSDFYCVWNFIEKIKGNPEADTIDVYEALDMSLPGLFAYRSILAGSIPMEIPDLRDPAVREKYRFDNACTDPKVAGDQLLPCAKGGSFQIDPQVYKIQRQKWLEENDGYVDLVMGQGKKK